MGNTETVNRTAARAKWRTEGLAGITVAFALIPEALAFAILVGLPPSTGLYTAFLIGFTTTVLGTRPGMISGATGAVTVMLVPLSKAHGPEYVFAAVVIAGLLQGIAGLLKAGRLTRLLTPPIMMGFMNGLAIILFMSQLSQFEYKDVHGAVHWVPLQDRWLALLLVGASILITTRFPRLSKVFPATLAAIILLTFVTWSMHLPVQRVGDIASIHGGLPVWHVPMGLFSWATVKTVLPYSLALAAVGLIESLLTLTMLDDLEGERSSPARELFVQGAGNFVAGFFGGMGGCAMTGQTRLNYNSGGRGRLSGYVASLMLLVFVLVGAAVVEAIPVAALTGIMVVIAVSTFQWRGLLHLGGGTLPDLFAVIIVMVISVVFENLAFGVICGVVCTIIINKIKPKDHVSQNNTSLRGD
ncbi:MAG TPA: SulP family inorganic anion transporter [Puia sp.]|nr:SulP family inorganic anion transporter [Puia sp.]